jgi:hypothetical protein
MVFSLLESGLEYKNTSVSQAILGIKKKNRLANIKKITTIFRIREFPREN